MGSLKTDLQLRGLDLIEIEHIATRLVEFHAHARSDDETAQFGTIEAVGKNVVENFAQTRESIAAYLKPGQADEIERWQTSFLHDNADLFNRRIVDGRVRDGHGDLRLEHVYLEGDHVSILDCIEFNERFRYADVAADIAFLSMDLAWHGRVDLAEVFLATYAREANDYDLYPLSDFYESYRAYVRGKVASLLANDPSAPWPARERAAAEARRYYLLALATERRSLVSQHVVAVGGLMGSGKSTVARQIGFEMAAPIVDTDRTRKWLLGVNATDPLVSARWAGAYAPDTTERVYEEVLRRAAAVLRSGRPVIVDASFRSRAHRDGVRDLARQHGVPFAFVECTAPQSLRAARLRAREGRTTVSDGRLDIDEDFRASWEPAREIPADEHIVLNTAAPVDGNVATLRASLAMWPPARGTTTAP